MEETIRKIRLYIGTKDKQIDICQNGNSNGIMELKRVREICKQKQQAKIILR